MLADGVIEAFRLQAEWCTKFGSPLYAELIARSAEDIVAGGPAAAVVDGWEGKPIPDALVMRFMGGVHRLVLDGQVPALARFYPSAGGTPRWPQAWEAFRDVLAAHRAALRAALDRQVQTNEVRRSAALLGGFLRVARAGLPLRLLEIGSSAGLNLGWDRYRYDLLPGDAASTAQHVWGDPSSPVSIRTVWEGSTAIFASAAQVAERTGCDLAPIDVCDPSQVRTLESFIWADQLDRLAQLRAAVALARQAPARIERRAAADWLAAVLAQPRDGVATVVFHSIMWWYLSEVERLRITALIEAAGARASARAPLAWLRLEMMAAVNPDLRLSQWPDGSEVLLAHADAHGRFVRWVEP